MRSNPGSGIRADLDDLDDAAVLPAERADRALAKAAQRQRALERAQSAVHLVCLAEVSEQPLLQEDVAEVR